MNRRSFVTRAALSTVGTRFAYLAAVSGVALTSEGCNVFSDIANWVPVGEAAVNSIVSVLTSNGFVISTAIQTAVNLIFGALTSLDNAIIAYQSTTPPPAGTLDKVETFIGDVLNNFKSFLASLNISGGLLGIITGLATVVLSTIEAFINDLPATTMPHLKRTIVVGDTFRIANTTMPIVPVHRTRRVFKRNFNSVLDSGASVDVLVAPSAYMHLTLLEHL
jgi:hypothetical protein